MIWPKGKPFTEEHLQKLKNNRNGNKHYNWKGGRRMNLGYVLIYTPGHPAGDKNKYVYEHRLVVEKCIGRYLEASEVIHHLNRDRADNRPENLIGFKDKQIHMRMQRIDIKDLTDEIAKGNVFFDGRKWKDGHAETEIRKPESQERSDI